MVRAATIYPLVLFNSPGVAGDGDCRPSAEALEVRIALDATAATYTWTAFGDGTSFNDPNNWSHIGPFGGGVGVPGVPAMGSNLVFPSMGLLPANSPTTIDFNSGIASFPVGVIQIGDSYTFDGNGVSVAGGILVANPYFGKPTDATILLASVHLRDRRRSTPRRIVSSTSATPPTRPACGSTSRGA